VKRIIAEQFNNYAGLNCLDIGTADGLMLGQLQKFFGFSKAIGIDMSQDLIDANQDPNIKLELGDAENLRFENNSFDVITACAVIEHVNSPAQMLSECRRVLKQDGILVLTTPNPWLDKISEIIGYSSPDEHIETLTIAKLKELFKQSNLRPIQTKYFMFFPFFKIPFENQFESFLNLIGLEKAMCNQIIVGQK
jgi:ubiquinone/menaquinone biosynthesis C-methylase UbiE